MTPGTALDPPLKLGYVVKRYPRFSETFVVNEVLAHEEAGAEVTLFALYPPNDSHFQDAIARVRAPVVYLAAEGLRAHDLWEAIEAAQAEIPDLLGRLPIGSERDARRVYQALLLAAEARRRGLDHLHAHFATAASAVARAAAALAGLPYSFTAHAKDLFHDSVALDELARLVDGAAAVVTVSDFNLAWLRERFPRAAGRLHRIYNGLLLEQFPFPPPPRRARTIVSVGRLIEKKGFDQLIDACALLAADGVGFDCAIVGTGELEEALAARIARLGLGARVRLLGSRPRSEVIEIVRGAVLFAGPYTIAADGNRDGLPTVLTEAMALGTPCVASAVTGVPEIVEDGVTGLLVPPDDVAALAAAIRRLLDAPALGERLARAARQRVEERFDARRSSAALRALFAPARPGEAVARAS